MHAKLLSVLACCPGGGLGDNGDTPAKSADDVARNAWRGIWKE
jgi:hypothetical protein